MISFKYYKTRFGYFTIKSCISCIITVKKLSVVTTFASTKPSIIFNHNILLVEFKSIEQNQKTNSHRVPQTVISNEKKRKMIRRYEQYYLRHPPRSHECVRRTYNTSVQKLNVHRSTVEAEIHDGDVCARFRFRSRDKIRAAIIAAPARTNCRSV